MGVVTRLTTGFPAGSLLRIARRRRPRAIRRRREGGVLGVQTKLRLKIADAVLQLLVFPAKSLGLSTLLAKLIGDNRELPLQLGEAVVE
jgi:hypothetical protein